MQPQPISDPSPVSGLRASTGEASEPARLTPSELPAGQIVAGKYRVERWVGEGAMGVVLAATHLGLDETVAIKLIRPDAQRSTHMLSRFAKEAKIAARIRSEHVPRVLDVGISERFGPYIVMEYLEGRSLAELLDAEGKLEAGRAVEYVLQACEALAAAHAIGVIHRDIKPGNLFITQHGSLEVLKLLDFGISKAALTGRVFGNDLALSETSHVMGTPMYMSPEQIRSAPDIDSRTDIWSLGAVIYELVTGKTAFDAESVTEICAQILEGPTPALDAVPGPEGKVLQEVIQRCLSRDPAERFQTVADVAAALMPLASESARLYADRSSCILRGSGLELTRASRSVSRGAAERSASPRRRRRPLRWVGTGLALATLGALLSSAIASKPETEVYPRRLETRASLPAELEPLEPPPAFAPDDLRELFAVASEPPLILGVRAPAVPMAADPPRATPPRTTRARAPAAAAAEPKTPARAVEAGRIRLVQSAPRMRLVGLGDEP